MTHDHGLVVGKFYPPHIGHHKLISTALAECDRVTVVVMYSSVENIDVRDRVRWLEEVHPEADVFAARDDSPVLYTEETWGHFMEALWSPLWMNSIAPTVVYSGEDWAQELARRLTEIKIREIQQHIPVRVRKLDRHSGDIVCSATEIRRDPVANWDKLTPPVRAGLCKRVVVVGPESSGTTTLAKDLANYYKTTVVPEYGRHFEWAVGPHHEWVYQDFADIAVNQRKWENELAYHAQSGLLVCDTDEYATAMFLEQYLTKEPDESWHVQAMAARTPADLYLITSPVGVPFEDDGQRDPSRDRYEQYHRLYGMLYKDDHKFYVMTGDQQTRLAGAVGIINQILSPGSWKIEEPLEYR